MAINHYSKLTLTRLSSAPILATIFILFGIGYTIDYNSKSPSLRAILRTILPMLTTLTVSSLFPFAFCSALEYVFSTSSVTVAITDRLNPTEHHKNGHH